MWASTTCRPQTLPRSPPRAMYTSTNPTRERCGPIRRLGAVAWQNVADYPPLSAKPVPRGPIRSVNRIAPATRRGLYTREKPPPDPKRANPHLSDPSAQSARPRSDPGAETDHPRARAELTGPSQQLTRLETELLAGHRLGDRAGRLGERARALPLRSAVRGLVRHLPRTCGRGRLAAGRGGSCRSRGR